MKDRVNLNKHRQIPRTGAHSPNISLQQGHPHTITKQRTIQYQSKEQRDYVVVFTSIIFSFNNQHLLIIYNNKIL